MRSSQRISTLCFSYLQVNRSENDIEQDIEPLDIPGVELEETEVRHKQSCQSNRQYIQTSSKMLVRMRVSMLNSVDRYEPRATIGRR